MCYQLVKHRSKALFSQKNLNKNVLRQSDGIKMLEKSTECAKKNLEAKNNNKLNVNILILFQKPVRQC